MQVRKEWHNIFQVLKEKKILPRILYPERTFFRLIEEIKWNYIKCSVKTREDRKIGDILKENNCNRAPAGCWWGTLTPKEMGGTPQ